MKFAVVILAAVALCHASPNAQVTSGLQKCLESKRTCDVMVVLRASVQTTIDAINSQKFVNSGVKATHLAAALREFTSAEQSPILDFLSRRKAATEVTGFWITNKISIKNADLLLVDQLVASFPRTIAEIREAVVIHLEESEPQAYSADPNVLEWGVDNIDADLVWPQGFGGQGIVVSSIDTGVRGTHSVLRDNKRATHSWFDASTVAAQEPVDDQGHGTHTMGSICGKTGTGVAPDSEWIHCRGFEGASATEEDLVECGQWTLCPTNPDGTGEDCTLKPQVSSNSWGGGNDDPFYNDIISSWRSADIIPVFAIGNSGPGCRTANSPGDQPNLISAGATNAQNLVMSFSSHGPSRTNLIIKPDVSAPGNNVRSASHYGDALFVIQSGTSMACPHVAGAVALLLSKNPAATFDDLTAALYQSTLRPEMPDLVCTGGGVNTTYPWPNNSHGWGKINVNAAIGVLA